MLFNGDLLWSKTYGSVGDDFFYDVKAVKDDGSIACGNSNSNGNKDIYIVRTDNDGYASANCSSLNADYSTVHLTPTTFTVFIYPSFYGERYPATVAVLQPFINTSPICTENCSSIVKKHASDFFPNLITRNNDQKNDVFQLHHDLLGGLLIVSNQWGSVVYQNQVYNNDFDGEDLNDDVYYYFYKTPCDQEYKGWVQSSLRHNLNSHMIRQPNTNGFLDIIRR